MAQLVIAGQVAPMVGDVPDLPRRGRVWIRDDQIVDVTFDDRVVDGFAERTAGRRRRVLRPAGLHRPAQPPRVQRSAAVGGAAPYRPVVAQQGLAAGGLVHGVDHRAGLDVCQGVPGSDPRVRPGAGDGGRSNVGAGLAVSQPRVPDRDAQRRRRARGPRGKGRRRPDPDLGGDQDRRQPGRRGAADGERCRVPLPLRRRHEGLPGAP